MPRAKAAASLSFGQRFQLISPGEDDTIAEDGEAFPRMLAAARAVPRDISGRHVECTPCSTVNNSVIPVV
jgi:hypothetical protein